MIISYQKYNTNILLIVWQIKQEALQLRNCFTPILEIIAINYHFNLHNSNNNNQQLETKQSSLQSHNNTSLSINRMFRNIYIQAYKNAIQQNSTLEFILIHANHIYAGLGCIMQDIQFMVGNLITQLKVNAQTHNNAVKTKNQGKERTSANQKIEEISFKLPKFQFLPSSSFKSQNFQYRFRFNDPQQTRSNAVQTRQQAGKQKKQSFTQMFPQQQRKKRISTENQNNGNSRGGRVSNNSNMTPPSRSPPASQQDLMDYLFKKNNKS